MTNTSTRALLMDWIETATSDEFSHESNHDERMELRQMVIDREWKPIETAPRDRQILIFTGMAIYSACWVKNMFNYDEAWLVAAYGGDGDQLIVKNPTHWMPLPEPPREEE